MLEYILYIMLVLLALEWIVASKGSKTIKNYFLLLHHRRLGKSLPQQNRQKKVMNLKKQLQEKNRFLKQAYEEAYNYSPSSPLSVDVDPIELGKSIGYNESETMRIMMELVEDGYVKSTLGMGSLFITKYGLSYLRQIEDEPETATEQEFDDYLDSLTPQYFNQSKSIFMKQTTKLDLILRELYKYKNDGRYHSIAGICMELNLPIDSLLEINRLGHRLKDDGLILPLFTHNDCSAELTTYGIDYCEENSYTYSGQSIITNNYTISIVDSPNANIVNQSSNVKISTYNNELNGAIAKIFEAIAIDNTIQKSKADEISECLKEIQESLKNNQKPKFAIKSLIEMTSGISSIASWVTVLGQFAGIIPVLK